MSETAQDTQEQMMPTPDPALSQLDRFVGTWSMEGRLEGQSEATIHGRTTYEWLPGGFFLKQHMTMDFAGFVEIDSTEIVGYDPETGTFPLVFSISAEPLLHWRLDGDELQIRYPTARSKATYEAGLAGRERSRCLGPTQAQIRTMSHKMAAAGSLSAGAGRGDTVPAPPAGQTAADADVARRRQTVQFVAAP